jgi:phosphotriesterase-related protein
MIQLINKKIQKENVKGKFILSHEHLNFDLTHIRKDNTSLIKDKKLIKKELSFVLEQNLGLIVDLSNQSMNSNKRKICEISEELNIPIVTSTGYYLNDYELNNKMTISELENEFYKHITIGFEGTNLKAGIIGEIATSSDKIHSFEKKVFQAAVNVQKKIGVPIYTHVNLGKLGYDQALFLKKISVNTKKTIIGHVDLIENIDEILKILKLGFNIGIDTIGKQSYLKDEKRICKIIKLIELGFEDKIVISLDISRKEYLKSFNGHGYSYLINNFYKEIKNKISKEQ